ncbi:MAG: hypothetical protein V9G12_17255 [Microthrixaceae bacterium]
MRNDTLATPTGADVSASAGRSSPVTRRRLAASPAKLDGTMAVTGANAAAPLAARIADANAWPAGRPEGTT